MLISKLYRQMYANTGHRDRQRARGAVGTVGRDGWPRRAAGSSSRRRCPTCRCPERCDGSASHDHQSPGGRAAVVCGGCLRGAPCRRVVRRRSGPLLQRSVCGSRRAVADALARGWRTGGVRIPHHRHPVPAAPGHRRAVRQGEGVQGLRAVSRTDERVHAGLFDGPGRCSGGADAEPERPGGLVLSRQARPELRVAGSRHARAQDRVERGPGRRVTRSTRCSCSVPTICGPALRARGSTTSWIRACRGARDGCSVAATRRKRWR